MSDPRTPQEVEDRLLSELLEELGSGGPPAGDRVSEAPELRREYLELLGLLPFALEPVAIRAESRDRLLETVSDAGKASPEAGARVSAFPPPDERRLGTSRAELSRSWILPLAAGLAALLVGLSGWQFSLLRQQRRTIDEMASRIRSLEAGAETEAAVGNEEELPSPFSLVTSPGVEICPLRPMGNDPVFATARGVLYVAADHQRWYLSVEGLQPCPEGSAYKVWFHAEQGPIEAGVLEVVEGARVELVSNRAIPLGMEGVSITMEPMDGGQAPAGRRVLYGDEMMRVL